MSQSRALLSHIEHLKEIRSILHSLKNMASMDVHKLGRLREAQNQVAAHIETVATDFLQFYPGLHAVNKEQPAVMIAIGSERGFCGNFNEAVVARLIKSPPDKVLAVGGRLINRLENTALSFTPITGANSSEEITEVLSRLTDAIGSLHQQQEGFNLSVLFHQKEHKPLSVKSLLPPFIDIQRQHKYKIEPVLNLQPEQFFLELVEHFIFSSLLDILYASLAVENNQRLQHLDNAVRHLDQASEKLRKKSQIYRQEEITEEIEVILLNAEDSAELLK